MSNESTDAYRNELARRALAGDRAALQEWVRAVSARQPDRPLLGGSRWELQDLKLNFQPHRAITEPKDVSSSYGHWSKIGYISLKTLGRSDEEQELLTKVALAETFRQLTSKQQIAFSLWAQGASTGEIARGLGVSRSQAYRIVAKIQEEIAAQMERVQTADPDSLLEMAVGSNEFERSFDEALAEIDEIRSRMQQTQVEIDRHKETTRSMIAELGF
jgi:transposase